MTRDDERRQMKGAGVARSPGAARRAEAADDTERVSRERDDPMREVEEKGEDASDARSPGAARRTQTKHDAEDRTEESDRSGSDEVRGGRGMMHEKVDADHVIGTGGSVGVESAEGEVDGESAKAERKEAMEPERAMNEERATRGERTVSHKNTIGHGERETIGRHTI